MRHAVLLLLLNLLPGFAVAEPAIVRSGEHSDFTRLVLYLPEQARWSVEQAGRSATFTVEDWSGGFDIATVFKRIPRTRLSGLKTEPGSLKLDLNCECSVTTEGLANGPVVLDIRGEAPGLEDVSEPPSEIRRVEASESAPFRLPTVLPRNGRALPISLVKSDDSEQAEENDLALFRRSLLREVGQAASESLLTPALERVRPDDGTVTSQEDEPAGILPPVEQPLANEASDQIRVRAASEASDFPDHTPDSRAEKPICLPPEKFAVSSWSDGRDFAKQLGSLRAGLFKEFDQVDQKAALQLARLYLHFAFVDEARAAARTIVKDRSDAQSILAISDILDARDLSKNTLRDQMHCAERVRFWSFLAQPDSDPKAADVPAFIREFTGLPRDVRALLAPRLITRFSEAGMETEAKIIQSDIARSDADTARVAALEAETFLDEISDVELEEMVREGDEYSAAALSALIDRKISTDARVDENLIELGFGLLRLTPDRADVAALADQLSKALARNGQFEAALMVHSNANVDAAAGGDLMPFIANEVLVSGTVMNQAGFALRLLRDRQMERPSAAQILDISRSLAQQGMPLIAKDLLNGEESARPDAETQALLDLAAEEGGNASVLIEDQSVPEPLRTELALRYGLTATYLNAPGLSEDTRNQVIWATKRFSDYAKDDPRGRASRHLQAIQPGGGTVDTLKAASSIADEAKIVASDIRALLEDIGRPAIANTN